MLRHFENNSLSQAVIVVWIETGIRASIQTSIQIRNAEEMAMLPDPEQAYGNRGQHAQVARDFFLIFE